VLFVQRIDQPARGPKNCEHKSSQEEAFEVADRVSKVVKVTRFAPGAALLSRADGSGMGAGASQANSQEPEGLGL
jgi:hypothetical protein